MGARAAGVSSPSALCPPRQGPRDIASYSLDFGMPEALPQGTPGACPQAPPPAALTEAAPGLKEAGRRRSQSVRPSPSAAEGGVCSFIRLPTSVSCTPLFFNFLFLKIYLLLFLFLATLGLRCCEAGFL